MHSLPTLIAAAAVLAAATPCSIGAVAAQTLRNPPDTTAPATTGRNPGGSGGSRATPAGHAGTAADQPTRPPLGDTTPAAAAASRSTPTPTAPGHELGVGPNSAGSNGTGLGGGGPSVLNPAGANAGSSSIGETRSNGGAAVNGSKNAPMGANGVRKIQ